MLTIEGNNIIERISYCNYKIKRKLPNGDYLKMHYVYLTKKAAVSDFNELFKNKSKKF